jgi:hypothetical protein
LATDSASRALTLSHACPKSSSPEPNRPNGPAFCPRTFCRLARIDQNEGKSIVYEIGVEREGSLELGYGSVVLAVEK